MEELQSAIDSLERYKSVYGEHRNDPENLTAYQQEIIGEAFGVYRQYYGSFVGETDSRYSSAIVFHQLLTYSEDIGRLETALLQAIYARQQRKEYAKEQTDSVPAELESMVAEYEKFKTEQAEQEANDGSANSVANAVKRARDAMIIRERLESIRKNRAELYGTTEESVKAQEDKRYEELITQICDPKAKNATALLEPVETALTEAVHSYIDQRTDITQEQRQELELLVPKIVDNAKYLSLNGAIDISNNNDLVVGIEVSLHLTSPQTTTPITLIYDDLQKQEQEIEVTRQNISAKEIEISKLQTQLERATSPEDITRILAELSQAQIAVNEYSVQIESIPNNFEIGIVKRAREIENHLESQVDSTVNNNNVIKYEKNAQGKYVQVKNDDGSPAIDRDFTDSLSQKAGKTISDTHEKLTKAGIQGKVPPAPDKLDAATSLEKAVRSDLPDIGLALNPTYEASRVAAVLNHPNAKNRDLSAEAVLLYGKGFSVKKLDEVIEHAQNNPQSELGRLLKANPNLFGELRHQLVSIEKTNTPESVSQNAIDYVNDPKNKDSSLTKLYHENRAAFDEFTKGTKRLNQKEISAFLESHGLDTKNFNKIGQEFNKIQNSTLAKQIGKDIGKITQTITGLQNRLYTFLDKFTPFVNIITDPFGSITSYLGRRAGKEILRQVSKVISEEAGKRLLELGAKGFVKELLKKAAQRAALEAAKLAAKAGIKIGAEALLGGSVFGAPLAALMMVLDVVGTFATKGLNQISVALTGEEFDAKIAARNAATTVVGGAFSATAAISGLVIAISAAAASATAAAAASAAGIIAISAFAGYFIYISTIVVAPLISTLVQLESQATLRVSGECTWPIHGGKTVCQGPLGVFTHSAGVQGIDICSTNADEIHAVAPGTVTFTGNVGDIYGNFVEIATQTSKGTFTARYAHMTDIGVVVGQAIVQDQVIGITGNSGSTQEFQMSDHLHMEYRGGFSYNDCPAGGVVVPEGCSNDTGSEPCLSNGGPIITD